MNNLEKLNKILSAEQSTWQKDAAWRSENDWWLSASFDIAVRVLETLRAKKMTQKELAERMNVSPQFINKIVKGQENLSLETIGKLSNALGIKLIEVVGSAPASEVVYNLKLAYELIERNRREIFAKASAQGSIDLKAVQQYAKEQTLEYKVPA